MRDTMIPDETLEKARREVSDVLNLPAKDIDERFLWDLIADGIIKPI